MKVSLFQKMNVAFAAACASAVFIPFASHAQTDSLGNEQISVVKAYQPTLSDAYKISELPDQDTLTAETPSFEYTVNPKKFTTAYEVNPILPVKQNDETLPLENKTFLKGGIGNHFGLFGEANLRIISKKDQSAGLYLHHVSMDQLNDNVHGLSDNVVKFYANRFRTKSLFKANVDFDRKAFHYYGYQLDSGIAEPNAKDLRQHQSRIGAGVRWIGTNAEKGAMQYNAGLRFNTISEGSFLYKATTCQMVENNLIFDADAVMPIGKLSYGLSALVDYNHDNTGLSKEGQAIVRVDPKVIKQGSFWRLTTGTNLTFQPKKNAAGDTKWNPYLFSDIDFDLQFIDKFFIMYGGIGGGMIKNNFYTLTEQNPFLFSLTPYNYSKNTLELRLGARGSISQQTTWNVLGSFSTIDQMPFFINNYDPALNSQQWMNSFKMVYDDGVEVLHIKGEFTHRAMDRLDLLFKADYYHYATSEAIAHPWHLPSVEARLSAKYELGKLAFIPYFEKGNFFLTSDVAFTGSRWALLTERDPLNSYVFSSVKLNPYTDVNLGVNYKRNDKVNVFLRMNNLAFQDYQRYLNYPSQKFNLMAGVGMVL